MAEPQLKRMTVAEFLDWQSTQDEFYELVDGLPVLPLKMMTGAIDNHDAIALNALGSLWEQLRRKPCRPRSQDIAIRIPCGYIRRPDVSVDCTPGGPRGPTATKPRMILEVLSPSTLTFDRFRKLEEYKTVPSVAVILLVDTQAPQVAIHRRRGELWQVEVLENPAGTIDLPEIGAVLPMAELYEGIEFDKK